MRFVITAGPTREYLDAVRFLSNPSTGKMGFALARAAASRGHEVILISGPVSLTSPKGVTRIDVVSARDMLKAVLQVTGGAKAAASSGPKGAVPSGPPVILVSTAAIADFRPKNCAKRKLHKGEMPKTIELVRNPDILKTVRTPGLVKVGFAAETTAVLESAARKCREKNLAFIVANDVTRKGAGFGTDTNIASLLFPDGHVEKLPLMTKLALGRRIVKTCEDLCL